MSITVSKKITFCVLAMFCVQAFCMDAPAVAEESSSIMLVSQENIDQAQQQVDRTLKFHWFLRGAKVVGATGAIAFLIYYNFFRDSGEINLPEGSKEKVAEASKDLKKVSSALVKKTQESVLSLETLNGRLKKVEGIIDAVEDAIKPKTWKSWFKKKISGYAEWGLFGGAVAVGQKIWGISSHDDDMKWFAREKTRVYQQIGLLRYYAQKVRKTKDDTIDSEQELYYKTSLVALCRNLVTAVEKLCGFMQYSLQQFQKRGAFLQQSEILQVPHLIATTNKLVASLQKKLPVGTKVSLDDLQDGYAQVTSFVTDLEKQISRFVQIEHDVEMRLGGV